jgi:hypothetical protein
VTAAQAEVKDWVDCQEIATADHRFAFERSCLSFVLGRVGSRPRAYGGVVSR